MCAPARRRRCQRQPSHPDALGLERRRRAGNSHGQSPLSRFSKAVSMNHFATNKHSYKPNKIKRQWHFFN